MRPSFTGPSLLGSNAKPIRAAGVLLLALLYMAGCAAPMPAMNPNPPPPRAEMIPKPPVSEQPLVWQPGHWDWVGNGFAWREGEWVPRAGHGTEWEDGYWSMQNGVQVWMPAHWM